MTLSAAAGTAYFFALAFAAAFDFTMSIVGIKSRGIRRQSFLFP